MRAWSGDNIYNDERGEAGGILEGWIVKSEVGGLCGGYELAQRSNDRNELLEKKNGTLR